MQDRMYLLSIEALMEENIPGKLQERALRLLDGERLRRVNSSQNKRKQAENIGAGLLMQLAVSEMCGQADPQNEMRGFTVPEVLNILEKYEKLPLSLEYTYAEQGKPFLKNYPYYFNLSHSGSYVFCVISKQEVGADIQWMDPRVKERIVQRFFSEEEKCAWEHCGTSEEKRALFYQLWARKEAYGKLTGKGIGGVIGEHINAMETEHKQVVFKDYELENYRISICKWK